MRRVRLDELCATRKRQAATEGAPKRRIKLRALRDLSPERRLGDGRSHFGGSIQHVVAPLAGPRTQHARAAVTAVGMNFSASLKR